MSDYLENPAVQGFLEYHRQVESAPRTVCAVCQFETPAGRKPAHAPGCEAAEE